jgi:prepilin-type N-terminal cleavage/methylation domain-containing protein
VSVKSNESGFTLIELIVAMAVFSFMLLIIVVGILNIIRFHDSAIASNVAQDNARTAMDEVVQAVRNSSQVNFDAATNPGQLCLSRSAGSLAFYYVSGGVLYRRDNSCTNTSPTGASAITTGGTCSSGFGVCVRDFTATRRTSGSNVLKPEVDISITVGSSNGTTTGLGAATTCANNNAARQYCSVITLKSGAVPR